MIVKGVHEETTSKEVSIEVDKSKVLFDLYWELLNNKPDKAAYISGDHWYVEVAIDQLNTAFIEDRKISFEEHIIHSSYKNLERFCGYRGFWDQI